MRREAGAATPGPWVGMEGMQSQGPAGGLERGAERGGIGPRLAAPHPRTVFPAVWGDLRWCLPSAPLGRGRTPQKGVRGTQAALRLDSSRVPQEGVGFAWRTVC